MAFSPATTYRARIGGLLYRDVVAPIVFNGLPLITLARNDENAALAVSLELRRETGAEIASVVNNQVSLHAEGFILVEHPKRRAVIESGTGRVWLDLKTAPVFDDCELELSCILVPPGGYPVLLHPDRTKCGSANDNRPPNISRLTMTTAPGSGASAIALKGSGLYLLGLAIENFQSGISMENSASAAN